MSKEEGLEPKHLKMPKKNATANKWDEMPMAGAGCGLGEEEESGDVRSKAK